GTVWNGRLGFGLLGDANNQITVVDDAGTATGDLIPSEAHFMTVKTGGTYFAYVDSATAATGGPTATYSLSVSVHPAGDEGVNCTTYTSTDVPKVIGPGAGLVSSVISVPGNPIIADLDVSIVLDHTLMNDVDAHLRSPAGNDNGLFTDIGATAVAGQAQMDATFDDEAALIPAFTTLRPIVIKPEVAYRLNWFDGENAGGTWTLDLRDDGANASGGNLTAWSIRICEPPPPPSCPAGTVQTTVFSTDFESGPAGFTHSGTADEWELGLPATAATTTSPPVAAFTTCNSGVNCWKTDLDNTYNPAPSGSVTQDLLSAPINLVGFVPPVLVTWAHRHQVESANFDHYFVDLRQVGGANPVRLFEWLDATPTSGVGNPTVNIGESSGWATLTRRADSLAGANTELLFHMDQDNTVQLGGVAIDDVTVTACALPPADLSITKTDGQTTAIPGQPLTYVITASNAGPTAVSPATVADTFPGIINCPTWTCVGAGGGTCTGSGSGSINDTNVNLPVGGSVTYTAQCGVGTTATGTLTNTATVASGNPDPDPNNNSATDIDTLVPTADLSITKTDGVTTAVPGQTTLTYTIVASNAAGPSDVTGTVADTFPASLTCNWTCVGSGPNAGSCTAAGSGNINDPVTLPTSGIVTYTAVCSINPAATGSLSNTATVATAATDPNPGNNSATDTDTLTPQADVAVELTVDNPTPGTGTNVTFSLSATNNGP
ncbi:MAG TPA: proprotein convertase P-domain-containing protein, partial [Vicinamibacteria bacterium]|nr:proprotein convertase P-domain-containing protein [Vicinamibacteria bacterium]